MFLIVFAKEFRISLETTITVNKVTHVLQKVSPRKSIVGLLCDLTEQVASCTADPIHANNPDVVFEANILPNTTCSTCDSPTNEYPERKT